MIKTETYYKIYNPTLDKFSKGTSFDDWSNIGKRWKALGHLRRHVKETRRYSEYADECVIIQYIADPGTSRLPVNGLEDFLKESIYNRNNANEN